MIEVYTGQDGQAKKVWLSVYPKAQQSGASWF